MKQKTNQCQNKDKRFQRAKNNLQIRMNVEAIFIISYVYALKQNQADSVIRSIKYYVILQYIYHKNKMDNQFLTTPLLTSGKNRRKSQGSLIKKDELIKGLQLKNEKLRTQIMKIQNTIDENLSFIEGLDANAKKQRKPIMRNIENPTALNKQLANAYKKIKMYQYEVQKIKDNSSNGEIDIIHKAKQLQGILKQKKSITDKLKLNYASEQKMVAENTKKLNNNNFQNQIEKKIKLLTDEAKFLRQKIKDHEAKSEIKQSNLKKQFLFIKKLEEQLLESGMSNGQLDQLKSRVTRKMQANNSIAESHISKSISLNKNSKQVQIMNQEVIEDRTKDRYHQLCSQVKLLEKLQHDYEKQIEQAENQKSQAIKTNTESRNRLLEIEIDIEKVQRQILVLKGQVIPSNMKPLRPLRSFSSHHTSENKQKKIPAKNFSAQRSNKTLNHLLKFDEVGMTSEKGQRFTDRNIIGKNKLFTKITGLLVFLNSKQGKICGIQATYGNKRGGQYVKKDRDAKQPQYEEERITCGQNQWIKNMSGTLTDDDKLESLYVITSKGQSKRFGQSKNTKKSFTFEIAPDQVPVCIFGALCMRKELGKLENSVIEHFGIQLNTQSSKFNGNLSELEAL